MKLRLSLSLYLFRDGLGATALCTAALAAYVLLHRSPLEWTDPIALLILAAQSVILSRRLAWSRKGEAAFLYTRGFSRDSIWCHRILVCLLSGVVSTGVAALIVWIGIREEAQLSMGNSIFPIVSIRETWVAMQWFGVYALLVPFLQYAWARGAIDGMPNGYIMAVLALVMLVILYFAAGGFGVVSLAVASASLTWLGGVLHRYVEVQS
jgi:hypothetical protein